jgi:hypothetical protein
MDKKFPLRKTSFSLKSRVIFYYQSPYHSSPRIQINMLQLKHTLKLLLSRLILVIEGVRDDSTFDHSSSQATEGVVDGHISHSGGCIDIRKVMR